MNPSPESSDRALLELLSRQASMSVAQMATAMNVTATAVRQRLNRVMGQGLVERALNRSGRGRPSFRYQLTELGRRRCGNNFADLASALWNEIRAIRDPAVRKGLLRRVADRMAERYRSSVRGWTPQERLRDVARLLGEREIPCDSEPVDSAPGLKILVCPYPSLAEEDRGVCAMEKMLVSELVGEGVRLSSCRLDGDACCAFTLGDTPSATASECPCAPLP